MWRRRRRSRRLRVAFDTNVPAGRSVDDRAVFGCYRVAPPPHSPPVRRPVETCARARAFVLFRDNAGRSDSDDNKIITLSLSLSSKYSFLSYSARRPRMSSSCTGPRRCDGRRRRPAVRSAKTWRPADDDDDRGINNVQENQTMAATVADTPRAVRPRVVRVLPTGRVHRRQRAGPRTAATGRWWFPFDVPVGLIRRPFLIGDFFLKFFPVTYLRQPTKESVANSTDYSPPNDKSFRPVNDDLLANVFITVKTTGRNHLTRLPVVIKTWFQLAKKQVGAHNYVYYCKLVWCVRELAVTNVFLCQALANASH